MRAKGLLSHSLLLLLSFSAALELPESHVLRAEPVQQLPPSRVQQRDPATTSLSGDSQCTNGPTTRLCWKPGYTVATDFDKKWPSSGNTVSYNWEIKNQTCSPDGAAPRPCLLINGQIPGPTIKANWGDWIQVTVKNSMQNNGTGIHFHGIRQLNTNTQDGVNGVTECPIAPGQSTTYRFQATQFGSTWYHSHFSAQYGDGIQGAIVIDGPSSSNYDVDLGEVVVNDWYYMGVFNANYFWNANLQKKQPGPPSDTILVNGKNKNAQGGGSYWTTNFTPGKKYKLRLINTSVDNAIRVSIDNHTMKVITSDLVPIKPIDVPSVLMHVGQRYDVIVQADQSTGNYWLQANAEGACQTGSKFYGRGVVQYDGAPSQAPTYTAPRQYTNGCNPPGALVPWVANSAGDQQSFSAQAKALGVSAIPPGAGTNGQNIVTWGINMTAMDVMWDKPTLSYVMNGDTNYPVVANLIEIPNENVWTYWIIQDLAAGPIHLAHPMHLHGHDFYILGVGPGTFNKDTDVGKLQFSNPPRRDTAILNAGGWLVIAFPTDNPGAWLLHCHIAWHISEGLGLQFLEAKSQINLPGADYKAQCAAWDNYDNTMYYAKSDSGLRLSKDRRRRIM